MEIVAGDTDSVFVRTNPEKMISSLDEVNRMVIPDILHSSGCRECAVRMEYDKGYKTLLIVTKKRYAGKLSLWKGRKAPDDMKPEVKGLEVQRSDEIKYGQRLQWKYIQMLLDPTIDPVYIERQLKKDGEEFFESIPTLEDIEIYEGLSKPLSEYKTEPITVQLAKKMMTVGEEFFVGMKIPYVVVEHKPNIKAILSSEYSGKLDKVYYWENKILPMIERLLAARFPGYHFRDFAHPNQFQLDFFGVESEQEKEQSVTTKKVAKTKKVKKVAKETPISAEKEKSSRVFTIHLDDEHPTSYVSATKRLAEAFVGDVDLKIVVKTESSEVTMNTGMTVSNEFKEQFKSIFSNVKLTDSAEH